MSALPLSHPEDVIIRRQATGTFTIGAGAGPPQIVCRSLGEALQRAASFAMKRNVGLWYTTDGRTHAPLADLELLRKIWNEYIEMPGLCLTREQAQRLWTVDAQTCTSVLESLVDLRFLMRGPGGKYARLAHRNEVALPPRMAKANVSASRPAGSLRHIG